MYIFLIIHILICILFCIYMFVNRYFRDDALYKSLIVIFIPLFGIAYFIVLHFLDKQNSYSKNTLLDYEEYIKSTFSASPFRMATSNKDSNLVPISEAFILNDNHIKRELLIDLVKTNSIKHIPILKAALENDDTEVSHYAASAITELKKYFMDNIQKQSVKYEQNRNDAKVLISYLNIIKQYINSGFLQSHHLEKYKLLYSEKLGELLKRHKPTAYYFIEKINCDIELKNFNSAKEYCTLFENAYKESDKPYISFMKLYYTLKDHENFKETLNKLLNSNLRFSSDTLNVVRFWNAGETNEH